MQCRRRDNTTPELFNTTYTTRRTQQLMHPDLNRDTVSIIPMHQALMKSYWTIPSAFKRRYFSRNLSLHRWQLFSKRSRTVESAWICNTHLFQFKFFPESWFWTQVVSQSISISDQSILILPLRSGTYLLTTIWLGRRLSISSSSFSYGCSSAAIEGFRTRLTRAEDGVKSLSWILDALLLTAKALSFLHIPQDCIA